MGKKVLIVVDMQGDFVDGPLGTQEARDIVPNVINKIIEYDLSGDSIIFTLDTHFANTYKDSQEGKFLPVEHCIRGTEGWHLQNDIDEVLCDVFTEVIYLEKTTFGSMEWMENIFLDTESIELIGVCTDICVVSNALILKACFPEIPIYVDASCCAGTTPEKHKAALEVMKSCQVNVIGE